ncbi:MAG: RodZ domain-containing protein [Blastocatellia bacterium]
MASLGQELKRAREERGITLHDIANSTHIGVRFLQAIESDNYDILPGGVFNRAFVRKFAKLVQYDEDQALKLYDEQLAAQGIEPNRTYQLGVDDFDNKGSSGNGLLFSILALVILAALAYAAYEYFRPVINEPNSGESKTSQLATAVMPAAQAIPLPEATPEPSPTASPEASPTLEVPAGALRVRVIATGECWIQVKPDAAAPEQALLIAGDTRDFAVNDRIVFLTVGNTEGIRVTINDRIVNFSKLLPAQTSVVAKNVVITKENYQQFLD